MRLSLLSREYSVLSLWQEEKGACWNPKKNTGRKAGALLPFSQLAACPPPAPELPAYQAVAQPFSLSPSQAIVSAGIPAT